MKQIISKILQSLTLLLSWLTISPLFVYFAWRWKLIGKKARVVLLLISPFMLVVYLIVFALVLDGYYNYQRKYHFADNEVIERITGVAFPELEIIDYKKGKLSFTCDYRDELTLEMEEELDESTYHYLDSIINSGTAGWSKRNDEYIYSSIWGNGLPAPKGENEEDDRIFSLSFKKGCKIIEVSSGAW